MESPQSQQLQQVNEKNNDYLFVKVFQLFSKGEIKILDEHKELVSGFPETNSGGSAEAKADSQDKSSLSISGAGHNKHEDILHIAAAYVNEENECGRTPLHLAAEAGDTELVDLFLKAGADVGAEDMFLYTPIHYSTFSGSINIVEILLKAGANVNAEEDDKQTPLHLSAKHGKKEVLEVLLKAGANVNAEDHREQTPLYLSAANGNKELVEVLLKAGANVNVKHFFKPSPLHSSARHGHKEVVEVLLKAGAKVNAVDTFKQTPLHSSARYGSKEVVEILCKAGANVDAPDKNEQTPLHLSAANGNKEFVEVLLKAGANMNAEDWFKQTPLHSSAIHGHKEVVEILLKAGANVNAADMNKQTPLHISAEKKHDDISELLLQAGASVKKINKGGHSVLDYMDDEQRVRLGFEPRTLLKLRNWMYSLTKSKKHKESSTSSKTKTEHTETISATFTGLDTSRFGEFHNFLKEDSGKENDDLSSNSSTLLTPGSLLTRSSVTSSGPGLLSSPQSPRESHDLDDSDLQELNIIRQQLENHLAKFSPETKEGCETSCSSKVKTALQAGRVRISATTNITLNKITKNIKIFKHHYEPGASLNIGHAENVALGSQTVVQSKKVKGEDDDDDSFGEDEYDSFSAEDTNNYT